jgi:tRNA(Ile)-lysidine synthase
VEGLATLYDVPFEHGAGRLGPGASEAAARGARYAFLYGVMMAHGADAIATAHHADDVLETAIINLSRGTGRRGLSSLREAETLRRPLLHMSKADIYDYAVRYKLEWSDDSTNHGDHYLRNRIRHHVLPRMDRFRLLARLKQAALLNDQIDPLLEATLAEHNGDQGLDRGWYASLPDEVAREVLATWLRQEGCLSYDAPGLHRLAAAARDYLPGKRADIMQGWWLQVGKDFLTITPPTPRQTIT